MWFKFPKGATAISIQQQEFKPQYTDDKGDSYFTAPAHFAALILGMPGYSQPAEAPTTDVPDVPAADPLRDGAIATLTAEVERLRAEAKVVDETMNAMRVLCKTLQAERDTALDEVKRLKEEAESDSDSEDE